MIIRVRGGGGCQLRRRLLHVFSSRRRRRRRRRRLGLRRTLSLPLQLRRRRLARQSYRCYWLDSATAESGEDWGGVTTGEGDGGEKAENSCSSTELAGSRSRSWSLDRLNVVYNGGKQGRASVRWLAADDRPTPLTNYFCSDLLCLPASPLWRQLPNLKRSCLPRKPVADSEERRTEQPSQRIRGVKIMSYIISLLLYLLTYLLCPGKFKNARPYPQTVVVGLPPTLSPLLPVSPLFSFLYSVQACGRHVLCS